MSTEELRRELARIGDTAPVVDVPDTTWARAQRARRRDRALAVCASVAVVALVAALGPWPQRSEPQPASTGGVGVPDVIHAVPAGALTPTDELAVGRAAVALTSQDGLPVVVDAEDGTYRALRLPGFGPLQAEQGALSLSPDGRQLAWAWSDPSSTDPTPTGVRVVDLASGRERSFPLAGGQGVFVDQLLWSPDSHWLLWTGANASVWTDLAYTRGPEVVAGRIGPSATTSVPVPAARDQTTQYAVSDRGEVAIATTGTVTRWDGEVVVAKQVGSGDTFTGSVVDAGNTVPVAAAYSSDDLWTVRRSASGTDYQLLLYTTTASLAYGAAELEVPLASELDDRGMVALGWLDSSHLLARTAGSEQPDGTRLLSDLTVLGVGDDTSYDVVGRFDEGVPLLSVALDLVGADQPTVDRPEPAWLHPDQGWSTTTWLLLVGGGLALAGVGALAVRRTRSSAARSRPR